MAAKQVEKKTKQIALKAAKKVKKKTKQIKYTSSHWKPGERPRRMRELKAELEKLRADHDELICLRSQVKLLKECNAEYVAEIGRLNAFGSLQYRRFKLQSRTESAHADDQGQHDVAPDVHEAP